MEVIKPPKKFSSVKKQKIFLAGSIEMGQAIDWQLEFQSRLAHLDVILLNPRRDDWDSSWEQTIDNENFVEQVNWELDGLSESDIIAMYFDPATKSPVTLLELGLFIEHSNLLVCCPRGFWRKGNVDIVCERYGIWQTESFDKLVDEVERLHKIFQIWSPISQR